MDIRQSMKRKSISNSRCVENISDKRLRIEIQPAEAYWVEREKRFVNVHLHCIVSNIQRIRKIRRCPQGEISVDVHGCTDFYLILEA